MKFHLKVNDKGFRFHSDQQKATFLEYSKQHPRALYTLECQIESKKQRGFYHGAVIKLWAYLDGKDHKDHQTLAEMHEIAKLEFNPQIRVVAGKSYKLASSTKFKLNEGYVEKIIDFLEGQYGIKRQDVLDPDDYVDFRDRIYPTGKYDTYIDYLLDLKKL